MRLRLQQIEKGYSNVSTSLKKALCLAVIKAVVFEEGKCLLIMSKLWSKGQILSPGEESNLRRSNSVLRCSTTTLPLSHREQLGHFIGDTRPAYCWDQ